MTARGWRLALVASVVVQLVVLYWPSAPGVPNTIPLDKTVHLLVFAAVGFTAVRAGFHWPWVALALVVHAVASEAIQHWVLPQRSGDPADAVADTAGAVIGIALAGDRARAMMGR